MAIVTESPARPRRDLRDGSWFPVVAVLALLLLFGVVVARVERHDVVTGWQVLATCPAPADAVVPSVASVLDSSACTAAPTDAIAGRGWPVVAAVVPALAGDQPDVVRVRADTKARTIVLDYRPAAASTSAHIVFVEVPPASVPETPVTVTASPQR